MTILWINLAIVFTFSLFARYFSVTSVSQNSIVLIKPNKMLILLTIVCLVMISGLRGQTIGDTPIYWQNYLNNTFTWEYVKNNKDIGFGLFQMVLKRFTNDPQVMLFITALITNLLIIAVFYRYSRLIELSIFVYITSGFFITSMNGIRQCLAAAIVFAGTKFLIKGNWKRYFLIVLFASTIHESAFILIPIYFVVRNKAWTKTTLLLILMSIFIVIGFNQFTDLLFNSIQDTQYAGYKDFDEGGANILRVPVEAVPLLIAFFGRDKLRKELPYIDYFVNMGIICLVFMIISTQNWIFARFSIYFSLYQYILISWIIKTFHHKSQRFIYFSIIICYLIYHYYDSVITLNIVYRSVFFDSIFK